MASVEMVLARAMELHPTTSTTLDIYRGGPHIEHTSGQRLIVVTLYIHSGDLSVDSLRTITVTLKSPGTPSEALAVALAAVLARLEGGLWDLPPPEPSDAPAGEENAP